ncbi:MAG: P1 family peptidase [Chloroflexi bacterium]|nr:P1 family peptidase [Chloroflexota bacterium]
MREQEHRRKPLRTYNLRPGLLESGPLNAISDVTGIHVGHVTYERTGVTAILPAPGNIFEAKAPAAAFVQNGFGKAAGLLQVMELGTLETPVTLCNTLAVGRCADALIDHVLASNRGVRSVNPVVLECNDGRLNDIARRGVTGDDVHRAIAAATGGPVSQGAVGAGRGMVAFGVKGGIGTASRRTISTGYAEQPDRTGARSSEPAYTVGALVLANMGEWAQLLVLGVPIGQRLARPTAPLPPPSASSALSTPSHRSEPPAAASTPGPSQEATGPMPEGSIIMLLATNAPLDARQLGRLARRAPLGMARTGVTAGHGSGDFVLAWSTAHRVPNAAPNPPLLSTKVLHDAALGPLFQAAVEATEEAILNALFCAEPVGDMPALPVEEVLAHLRACYPEMQ